MKILVLGGNHDGERIEVPDENIPERVRLYEKQKLSLQYSPLRTGPCIKTEDYRLEHLYSGKEKHPVYLLVGESPEAIIPALLAGYRKPYVEESKC